VPWGLLADAVLVVHTGVVLFVVGGLAAIVAGNLLGWRWVNGRTFRLLHLVTIGVVVLQAWLGELCPLTILESWLRVRAGQHGYPAGFIAHWLHRLLYWEAPLWVFGLAYSAFGALVLLAWWRWPPRRHPR
jgi:polyferredoxin